MREVTVAGIRMIEATNEIVLLLAESNRQLPIWIGSPEAAAIALSQQGIVAARPLTHDLIRNVLDQLGAPCVRVEVTEGRKLFHLTDEGHAAAAATGQRWDPLRARQAQRRAEDLIKQAAVKTDQARRQAERLRADRAATGMPVLAARPPVDDDQGDWGLEA